MARDKRLTYRRIGEAVNAQAKGTQNYRFKEEEGEASAGFAFCFSCDSLSHRRLWRRSQQAAQYLVALLLVLVIGALDMPIHPLHRPDDATLIAFGEVISAWGEIEVIMGFLFRHLTDLRYDIGSIIFSNLSAQQQREMLERIGGKVLPDTEQSELSSLLSRVKKKATIRNHIVHGTWGTKGTEYHRFYQLSDDPEIVFGNSPEAQRHRAARMFARKDMERIVAELKALSQDMESLFKRVSARSSC